MKLLEERIRKDGQVRGTEVLKVDSFLNHQIDVDLLNEIGKELFRLFGDCGVTKILTIEASGIGIACVVAQHFKVPVVFAKKNKTKNIAGCVWNHEGLAGEGWLAVALVIFCLWRPMNAVWGSVLFGALMILYVRMPLAFLPDQLYRILPYVMTVIVLIFTSMRNRKDKQPPASLGLPYFREDR